MLMLSFNVTAVCFGRTGGYGQPFKMATSKHKNEPPLPLSKAGNVPSCLRDQTHLKCSLHSPAGKL